MTKWVPIWDLPARIFHWMLAAAVLVAYFVEPERGQAFLIHASAGYIALSMVLFRVPWGFIGSARSRFADFVYGRSAVVDYVSELSRLKPPRHIGHNPLGGWMILVLLAAVLVTALTGMLSAGRGGVAGPFAPAGGRGLGEVHEFLGTLLIILVVLHVCGVIVEIMLTRKNIVRSMITGLKELDEPDADREPRLVSLRRAIIPAIVVAAIGLYLFSITDFSGRSQAGGATGEESNSD